MNRRTFLAAMTALAGAILSPFQSKARAMHLYSNDEGELIAASSLEQAAQYHDCELGGKDMPDEGWYQVADGAVIPMYLEDEGKTESMTAREWAEDFADPDHPEQVATTYW